MTLDEFFDGYEESRLIFESLRSAVDAVGQTELRATRSQVAFRRRRAFAWAWIPRKYLGGRHAPLVLTIALHHKDSSPRWKEIVEPKPGSFTRHLELLSASDIDDDVCSWLGEAWAEAAWASTQLALPQPPRSSPS